MTGHAAASTLRIAVGFKVTPDYEALRPADWARACETLPDETSVAGPDVRFVRRVLGVFDEAALELALRVRDARRELGLDTRLTAFSIGGREAGPFMETLQALGYERACRVDAAGLDFAPAATAALVAACTQRLGGDVLLLGERGGTGGSGTVPLLAAEALGRPCVSGVTEVQPAGDDRLRVTFDDDDGPLRGVVAPPCVLAVGNAVVSMLRVPTLKERLAVRAATVAEYAAADLGVDLEAARAGAPALLGLETIERGRPGIVVTGDTPEELARALYDDHLRARLEQL